MCLLSPAPDNNTDKVASNMSKRRNRNRTRRAGVHVSSISFASIKLPEPLSHTREVCDDLWPEPKSPHSQARLLKDSPYMSPCAASPKQLALIDSELDSHSQLCADDLKRAYEAGFLSQEEYIALTAEYTDVCRSDTNVTAPTTISPYRGTLAKKLETSFNASGKEDPDELCNLSSKNEYQSMEFMSAGVELAEVPADVRPWVTFEEFNTTAYLDTMSQHVW